MTSVKNIWRHPIKSHGRESLAKVVLTKDQTMPFDRLWAVAHENAKVDWNNPSWVPCANFSRGSKAPLLMALNATVDEDAKTVTVSHPDLPPITIDPDKPADGERFIAWVKPLCPTDRAQPDRIFRAGNRGLTDSDFPSVSIASYASLRAFSGKARADVSALRFRGNIWIDDLPPWEEFNWIGKTVQVGTATLKIMERIERCRATTANPETGDIDFDTLHHLNTSWGHQDFGVRAQVVENGEINIGDKVVY